MTTKMSGDRVLNVLSVTCKTIFFVVADPYMTQVVDTPASISSLLSSSCRINRSISVGHSNDIHIDTRALKRFIYNPGTERIRGNVLIRLVSLLLRHNMHSYRRLHYWATPTSTLWNIQSSAPCLAVNAPRTAVPTTRIRSVGLRIDDGAVIADKTVP
jgi:hypothetical protein